MAMHDALAHAAGELVRIVRRCAARRRGCRPGAASRPRCARLSAGLRAVAVLDVDHLLADRQHRVERRHRVLEHHRDRSPRNAAQLVLGQASADRGRRSGPRPPSIAALAGKQADHAETRVDLPRAALADDADDAAARHVEIDVAQRVHPPARRREVDAEVADVEERSPRAQARACSLGSNTSRRASPRKVKPSVVRISGMPPAITSQACRG